jgi:SHS2 domain-containing protein
MPERKITYEDFVQKSNSGYVVRAPSLQRLFIDSALALTDHLSKLDLITESLSKKIRVQNPARKGLMVCWLNEIVVLFEKEMFLAKRIVFDSFDGKSISATLWGESYSSLKHGSKSKITPFDENRLELGELDLPELTFYAKIMF